uniref:Uncharacterized protein n=1 Tax=Oryza sativa subsp. japonica TaxID=39947 RepID=Q6YXJ0_ORYSJ|nr:hypothetical protein [Oryza sativa Japonica Group]BAD31481.1 hypothetical protein [Oryza sativa Japonica Group]
MNDQDIELTRGRSATEACIFQEYGHHADWDKFLSKQIEPNNLAIRLTDQTNTVRSPKQQATAAAQDAAVLADVVCRSFTSLCRARRCCFRSVTNYRRAVTPWPPALLPRKIHPRLAALPYPTLLQPIFI